MGEVLDDAESGDTAGRGAGESKHEREYDIPGACDGVGIELEHAQVGIVLEVCSRGEEDHESI